MRKYFVFAFLGILLLNVTCISQNLGCFTDYMGRFNVFDNGNITSYESNQVKQTTVGGNSIVYTDFSDNFKAYYQGKIYDLADFTPSKFEATDNLVIFYSNKILSVFDNGNVVHLPGWAVNYAAGDSIVGYFDVSIGYYQVYYGGKTDLLPDVVDGTSAATFKAGDNILAYLNADGLFKIFYHNQVYDQGTSHVSGYQAGSSTVAYMDEYNMAFKVFYDGNTSTLENIAPKSYKAGDQLVVWVDYIGNFKIFYKGDVTTVSTFEPDFYSVEDNVVAFGTANQNFSVFYKGQVYTLESNLPASYQLDFNSVAYADQYGYLKIFTDGQTSQACEIRMTKFKLTKNVLMFKMGQYDFNFFLNGKGYQN